MDLVKLFEDAMRKTFYEEKKLRSYNHNHPSEMTNCVRQFWYKANNVPISDEPSISMMFIWKQGHSLQDMMEEYLWDIPEIEDFIIEHPVQDKEHNIEGSCDLVVKVAGKWYVVDFKTTGATQFKEVQKKGVPTAYKWQVNLYMYLLKKMNPEYFENLDTAYLFFINKSPVPDEIYKAQGKPWLAKSPFYQAEIKYDPDLLETLILPQAEYFEEIRKLPEPPERDVDESSCMFCEYRTLCKKGDKK